jgi:hypothetical protein
MTAPIIETPRGSVVLSQFGKAELKWNTSFRQKWQKRYSDAQKFTDSEVLRLCEPYTPLLTGTLVKTSILGTEIGSGTVSWIAPYSKYQYYGKVMAGKPKTATAKNLVYHSGDNKRGSFWFARMKAVSGKSVVAGARRIAGGRR